MVRSQLGIHSFIRLSEMNRFETTIVSRQFLFYDIGLDGNSQTVGLSGKVSSRMIVYTVFLELVVTQIAPQDGGHTQFMRIIESLSDFHQLAATLFGTEIDSSTYSHCPHFPSLLDGAKQNLIVSIGIRQQLIMVQFYYKRYLMRIFSGNSTQIAESGCNCITTAFDGKLHNVFRIEINRIRSERSSGRMFDVLIDRKNGYISGVCQTTMPQQCLQTAQSLYVTVRVNPYLIDCIR